MPEPITTLGLGAIAAYLGKDGLEKLLGPTADYLGEGMRDFTQKRFENVCRIFKNANEKLGDETETSGVVPPKVLKTIINEGSYSEDDLAVEYFGGVLASSRTELGRDDRGARIAKLTDNLSTYQLRTHFLIYSTIRDIFKPYGYAFNIDDRQKMEIFLPYSEFVVASGFTQDELQKGDALLRHIFFGLANDGLIENNFRYGGKKDLTKVFTAVPSDGIICAPSALGAELFLWAFSEGDQSLDYIFSEQFLPEIEQIPNRVENTIGTKDT